MNPMGLPGVFVALGLLLMVTGIDMNERREKMVGAVICAIGWIMNTALLLLPYLQNG